MARKKVFNIEGAAKAKQIKGSVRSTVALDAIASRNCIHEDRKRKAKSSTRSEKHKSRYY